VLIEPLLFLLPRQIPPALGSELFADMTSTDFLPLILLTEHLDRHLRVYANDAQLPDYTTAQRVDDPFSGTGHIINRFTYTGDSLRRLCELTGPLEIFRKLSFDQASTDGRQPECLEAYRPHSLLPKGGYPESGIWEVKWENRDDAMEAKSILSQLLAVRWNWAHSRIKEGIHPDGRSAWQAPRTFAGHRPHGSQHTQVSEEDEIAKGYRTWGRDNRSDPIDELSGDIPLRLDVDEFPPLTNGNPPKRDLNHRRTISDDPVTPITPVSIRHASPDIVSHNEERPITVQEIPSISETVTPKQPAQKPEEPPRQGHSPQYDMTTLYITGIPRPTTDDEIRTLFSSYGSVGRVTRIPSSQ